ncbi:MAG: hypothetical protein JXB38_16510 [Anaerolineales bacterium]|nr:hypothetical protein [Anaerolineales bacterium]
MHKVECPSCAQTIRLEKDPKVGQLITCSSCETALVVATISPLTLNWVALDDHVEENPADHDRRRKSKKHKKRYERDDTEDFEDTDDDVESFGKRRRPKRTRNLDDDYDD